MLVALRRGDEVTTPFAMPVEAGEWEVQADRGSSLLPFRGTLGASDVWPIERELRLDPTGEPVLAVGTTPRVWVIDGRDRSLLPDASFVCSFGFPRLPRHDGWRVHSGAIGRTESLGSVEHGPNPIPGERLRGPCAFFVTSSGYTWGRIVVTSSSADSGTVALLPAGSLRARIVSGRELCERDCVLELRRVPAEPGDAGTDCPDYAFSLGESRTETLLEKLAAGRYQVSITRQPDGSTPTVLGAADVEIVAGVEAAVDLVLEDVQSPIANTHLSIVLYGDSASIGLCDQLKITPERVPARRPLDDVRLRVDQDVVERRADSIEWTPVPLPPGIYRLHVRPLGFVAILEVPEEVLHVVAVELPSQVEYTALVRERQSGKPVDVRWYMVASVDPAAAESFAVLPPEGRGIPAESNPFTFQVPHGSLRLAVDVEGDGIRYFGVDPQEIGPDHRLELEIGRVATLRVRLMEAGHPFPVPKEWWTRGEVTARGHDGRYLSLHFTSDRLGSWHSEVVFRLSDAGEYEVELAKLEPVGTPVPLAVTVGEAEETFTFDVTSQRWVKPGD